MTAHFCPSRGAPPEPGSLYDLLAKCRHADRPSRSAILWTDEHLKQFMDIEFKQLPKLPRSPIGTRVSEVVREEMTYLKSRRAPLAGKIEVLRSWLVKYLPQQDESPLPFYVHNRQIDTVETRAIFLDGDARSLISPILTYLVLDDIADLRTWAQQVSRSKWTPVSEAEDPYIAAIMVASAFARRKQAMEDAQDIKAVCRDHYLLAVPTGRELEQLFFYHAAISPTILDRLDDPFTNVKSEPLRVSYWNLPLEAKTIHKALSIVQTALPTSN